MSPFSAKIENNKIKERFLKSNRKQMWYHIVFWAIVLLLLILTDRNQYAIQITIAKELINVMFISFLVYLNLYILIPQYFREGKILLYIVLLIFTVVVISPIKTLILFLLFSDFPDLQQRFIENQAYIFISNLFAAGSSTIFKILSDWQKSDVERQELEFKTTQTELKFLRSQINPHFLFNTLNNLYALTLKKSDAAPETVLKLSEIMRYMLYECNERKVLLSKEINYLNNYIELEKLRLHNDFDIKLEVKGDIGQQKISPLLLTPFIENAFKHGINNQIKSGFIHIELKVVDEELILGITNSKNDHIPREIPNKKSGGIGLENVKRRLEILYPTSHQLTIEDNMQQYTIQLTLKLDYD